MTQLFSSIRPRFILLTGTLLFAACSVDTSGLLFDDDAFDDALDGLLGGAANSGGASSGGAQSGSGGASGGTTATGGAASGGTGALGGAGLEPLCEAGVTRCENKQVQVCAADQWFDVSTPCEFVCVDGDNTMGAACGGSCQPSTTQCPSDTKEQTCADSGEWQDPINCDFSCVSDKCGGECVPGTRDCSPDASLQKRLCNSTGTWKNDGDVCGTTGSEATCTEGVCTGSCLDGDEQCTADKTPQSCDNNKWWVSADSACEFFCDTSATNGPCIGQCLPGKISCKDSRNLQYCNSQGNWGASQLCANQACVDDKCVGECSPGATRCHASDPIVEKCDKFGKWQRGEKCVSEDPEYKCQRITPLTTEGKAIVPVYGCGTCQPGSVETPNKQCGLTSTEKVISRVCKEGTWQDSACSKGGCYQGICGEPQDFCDFALKKFKDGVMPPPQPTGCLKSTADWFCDGDYQATDRSCLREDVCIVDRCAPAPVPIR